MVSLVSLQTGLDCCHLSHFKRDIWSSCPDSPPPGVRFLWGSALGTSCPTTHLGARRRAAQRAAGSGAASGRGLGWGRRERRGPRGTGSKGRRGAEIRASGPSWAEIRAERDRRQRGNGAAPSLYGSFVWAGGARSGAQGGRLKGRRPNGQSRPTEPVGVARALFLTVLQGERPEGRRGQARVRVTSSEVQGSGGSHLVWRALGARAHRLRPRHLSAMLLPPVSAHSGHGPRAFHELLPRLMPPLYKVPVIVPILQTGEPKPEELSGDSPRGRARWEGDPKPSAPPRTPASVLQQHAPAALPRPWRQPGSLVRPLPAAGSKACLVLHARVTHVSRTVRRSAAPRADG